MSSPLISCLMVTAGRADLAERAVQCFAAQTWPRRELVIVDDGADDYEPMLARYRDRATIRYQRIAPQPGRLLGALRNLSLDLAAGDCCTQWDDDEWYHPERLARQMAARSGANGASVLRYTLMHVNVEPFRDHPFRTGLRRGTPGTLLHPRSPIRYPNLARGEDSVYAALIRAAHPTTRLGLDHSHLFIRCYHGTNTWEAGHFVERLQYTWRDKIEYLRATYLARNLWSHRAFQLTDAERASADAYLAQSRVLGLA